MRLLKALAFASGVVALATGPVQPLADQQTVQGDASLNPEGAVVASQEITPRDETVPSLEVDKRMNGAMATILMPHVADATAVVIAGVSVSFIMASRVIQRQGRSVTEWFVKQLKIHNMNNSRTMVQLVVGEGITLYDRHMNREFVETKTIPEGIKALKVIVSQLASDEL
ncbi:hypothetical protein E4U13_006090 [Claviceps humidiphila]|uniref:Uncharacterized protein n=1 Tax=Claviceps humidiphila TaxID=1294629 RepID=A0A9P7PVJ1_9HYPO|nr:hypothetical protein E4U13_006090 [Claviceps humidiphila]